MEPIQQEREDNTQDQGGDLLPSALPLVLHGNFWFEPELLKSIKLVHDEYKPRADDIILATFPKCGTTWLKALAFAITNRSRYTVSQHPLLTQHPQDIVPFLELPNRQIYPLADLDTMPSPRLLATHIPLSLLPESMTSAGCRFVYMCREPKDVFVSLWHFENRVSDNLSFELHQSFHLFCEGVSVCGPIWDHYLEYWNESKASPHKVLFLKYEEMMSDPVKGVKRLAEFLGAPFTEIEEKTGVISELVRLCSFEHLSSLDVNAVGFADRIGGFPMANSAYFRRGVVGDWVNHLNVDMAEKLDCIVKEKLNGTGLTF
ncbi:hypothetical protein ACP4OV_027993 [Aristida adscensionis]